MVLTVLEELDAHKKSLTDKINEYNTLIVDSINSCNHESNINNELLQNKIMIRNKLSKELKELINLENSSKSILDKIMEKVSSFNNSVEENNSPVKEESNSNSYANKLKVNNSSPVFKDPSWADECDEQPIFQVVHHRKAKSSTSNLSDTSSNYEEKPIKKQWVNFPLCCECNKKHPGK